MMRILTVKAGYSDEFLKRWNDLSESVKIDYYREVAAKFRRDFLPK